MNEQRHKRQVFFAQRTDTVQENWDDLQSRLHILRKRAQDAGRMDLIAQIVRRIFVLQSNKPNKKIYRSILKFADETESQIHKQRTR